MTIAIRGNDEQKQEWLAANKNINAITQWINEEEWQLAKADVYFDLLFNEENIAANNFKKEGIVFANAVITTCNELPENYIRINAWNGFLKNEALEIACKEKNIQAAENTMQRLQQKFNIAPDIAGMIALRIISMIINEAYFALGEEISTKKEIDTAMKLGTNYPYGPFEWSEKIGLKKVYALLKKLSDEDLRYIISPKLEEEVNK